MSELASRAQITKTIRPVTATKDDRGRTLRSLLALPGRVRAAHAETTFAAIRNDRPQQLLATERAHEAPQRSAADRERGDGRCDGDRACVRR